MIAMTTVMGTGARLFGLLILGVFAATIPPLSAVEGSWVTAWTAAPDSAVHHSSDRASDRSCGEQRGYRAMAAAVDLRPFRP